MEISRSQYHVWNQYYDNSDLDIHVMEVRYKRTSFSRWRSRTQIHNNSIKKSNCRINTILNNGCCLISKYSNIYYIIFIDSYILSHASKIFFGFGLLKISKSVHFRFIWPNHHVFRSTSLEND
jgi:hypothetical protein